MERDHKALPFTPWHRLEVRHALRLAVFHSLIDAEPARTRLRQLEADVIKETLLVHTAIDWTDVLREAERLGAAHNQTLGCRSSDLFHIAAAKRLECDTFLTLDRRQTAMAKAAGLAV